MTEMERAPRRRYWKPWLMTHQPAGISISIMAGWPTSMGRYCELKRRLIGFMVGGRSDALRKGE